jgi:hypothetical protein
LIFLGQQRCSVPAYSQFIDVNAEHWQPRACGIVALKILMDFHGAKSPNIDALISVGLGLNAYDKLGHGWIHAGLVKIAHRYALRAEAYDLSTKDEVTALRFLKRVVRHGPCIASIYKDFDAVNMGHLIVIKRITGTHVFYNEPAAKVRSTIRRKIAIDPFLAGWKRRIIIVKP